MQLKPQTMLKKIVIIGPESTGKTTLCEQLADHFHTNWVPEYAREYLLKNGKNYSYENLRIIAKGQLKWEDEFTKKTETKISTAQPQPQPQSQLSSNLLFIDTDMYVMKVWCEFVFGKCHQFILDEIVQRKYDLYLLCKTDLLWEKDELREYPDLETREKLYNIYKDILINQNTPWVEVSGDYNQRLQTAIDAVKELNLHPPSHQNKTF
jgi:NadR type nicotinamide-nucleotide adenylyltransferase